jgi:cell division protein ZapA (FtsZ GTPase activity inhibitor)
MSEPAAVSVLILGEDCKTACAPGQHAALIKATELLTFRMRETGDTASGAGNDRAAVTVAPNLASGLLLRTSEPLLEKAVSGLSRLRAPVASTLAGELPQAPADLTGAGCP